MAAFDQLNVYANIPSFKNWALPGLVQAILVYSTPTPHALSTLLSGLIRFWHMRAYPVSSNASLAY